MLGTLTARLFRSGLALLFCLSMAGAALGGAPRIAAQESDSPLPDFATLPADAELLGGAGGAIDAAGIGTLLVERIVIEPGSGPDPVAGPFVIMIEQGSLVYEDDLGLEAEITDGVSQFFAPGEGDSLTNSGDEPAVVIRAALIVDTPINGDPGPEDGGEDDGQTDDGGDDSGGIDETGDEPTDDTGDGDGPGEDTPVKPRDGFGGSGLVARQLGDVNALILQPADAPDEVVISLTDAGFTPDAVTIARGGVLVIENAGEAACTFTIAELDLSIDLGAGDIEQATIDGPAGEYGWECLDDSDEVIGDGLLTIVDDSAEADPTEEATEEAGETPAAEATATPVPVTDDAAVDGPTGELLQSQLVLDDARELYAAAVILHPGATISLTEADGAIGVIVIGGDLGVHRAGRAPATLRDGRAVTLPPGTTAELTNNGEAPVTIILAGVTGSRIGDTVVVTPTPETEATEEPQDDVTPDTGDTTGLYELFPTDESLAALGLYPTWAAFTEITDPASNTFWFADADAAADLLGGASWIQSTELRYSSNGEETNFGTVNVFGILIDSFEDEDGAGDLFAHIQRDPSGEESDVLSGVPEVNSVVELDLSGNDADLMIVAIHTGSYVITLFASGQDLDVQALIYEVAGLIFGTVG